MFFKSTLIYVPTQILINYTNEATAVRTYSISVQFLFRGEGSKQKIKGSLLINKGRKGERKGMVKECYATFSNCSEEFKKDEP